jgi:hypothetical protein
MQELLVPLRIATAIRLRLDLKTVAKRKARALAEREWQGRVLTTKRWAGVHAEGEGEGTKAERGRKSQGGGEGQLRGPEPTKIPIQSQ